MDDAKNLDLVRLVYKLIECISSYSGTTQSLWFYFKEEATDADDDVVNTNGFKSFICKAKLFGNTIADEANEVLRERNNSCTIEVSR